MPINRHGMNQRQLALLFLVFLCKEQREVNIEAAVRDPMACA